VLGSEEREYQIDVVVESYFDRYLRIIEAEMTQIAKQFRHRHVTVRNSIQALVKLADSDHQKKCPPLFI
jgi:hypothetical protein